MRPIDMVVVHCSATPPDMDIGVSEIRKWHESRGFRDIGYHHVIRRDGRLEYGRPIDQQGAHVQGFNDTSIGICLIGGTDANDRQKAEFNYTLPQVIWLSKLLNDLAQEYPEARLCGHRDLDPKKACPCFNVAAWWGGETLKKQDIH